MFFMLLYYSDLLLKNILIMLIHVGIFIWKTFNLVCVKSFSDSMALRTFNRYHIVLATLNCAQSDSSSPHSGYDRSSVRDRTTGRGGRTGYGRGCCGIRRNGGNVQHLS